MAKKSKKDKKEKKAAKKADKQVNLTAKAGKAARKATAAITSHPAVAEVVAAALVGAAAALRNPKKARALANAGSDRLEALGKEAADRGSALWALALEVGRKSLETFDLAPAEASAKPASKRKPAAKRTVAAKRKPVAAKRKAPAKKA